MEIESPRNGNGQCIDHDQLVAQYGWVRTVAKALQAEECAVLLVDTDWEKVRQARMAGLPCHYGSILAEHTVDELDLSPLGRLLAVTESGHGTSSHRTRRRRRAFERGDSTKKLFARYCGSVTSRPRCWGRFVARLGDAPGG